MPEAETAKLVQLNDLVNMAVKNDTLYPRKAAVTAEIEAKVAAQVGAVYKPAGSAASIDDLPELKEENLGKVVNLTAAITSTENFAEGAGQKIEAGTNIVVVQGDDADTYQYDALAGFIDITPLASKTEVAEDLEKKVDKLEGMGLSSNDFTTAEKTKLASIGFASSAEVDAALNSALGITDSSDEEEDGPEE